MRAIYYESHGTSDVLKFGELPLPEPASDQVLVEVVAAGVNPIDRRLRSGELQDYITRIFPVIPGWDLSGRIVKLGKNVTGWRVGDEVLGLAFNWSVHHGTYAEYIPVDASAIALKPRELTFSQAAALPLVSLTAWQSLAEYGELAAGQTVFIQAGAGGVGSVAIPMAKHLGATVYTTARSENADYLKNRGADNIIDYTQVDYEATLKVLEPEGVDLVLEALLGEGVAEKAIGLAKNRGVVVFLNNEPPDVAEIAERGIKTKFLHHRADGKMLAELANLFCNGAFPLPEIEALPLTDAAEAHKRSESGRTRGKIVLSIKE